MSSYGANLPTKEWLSRGGISTSEADSDEDDNDGHGGITVASDVGATADVLK